jgi:hypothetical protein
VIDVPCQNLIRKPCCTGTTFWVPHLDQVIPIYIRTEAPAHSHDGTLMVSALFFWMVLIKPTMNPALRSDFSKIWLWREQSLIT